MLEQITIEPPDPILHQGWILQFLGLESFTEGTRIIREPQLNQRLGLHILSRVPGPGHLDRMERVSQLSLRQLDRVYYVDMQPWVLPDQVVGAHSNRIRDGHDNPISGRIVLSLKLLANLLDR